MIFELDISRLGWSTICPSGVSIFVCVSEISRTVPVVPPTSISSPSENGCEKRMTSPPATLLRMSSAASVTPNVSTDMMAVSDEVLMPSASAVMMMVSRYRSVLRLVRMTFCSRSFRRFARESSREQSLSTSRTTIRQMRNVSSAERMLPML